MKNLITRILAVALICCMVFSFAACKDEAADDQGTTPPTTGDTNTGDDNGNWFEKDEGNGEGEGDAADEPCEVCTDEDGDLTCDVCGGEVEPEEWVYNGIEWRITRGGGCFKPQYQVNGTEFNWIADGKGETWLWLAQATKWSADYTYEPLELEEGTIEVVITSRSNSGIIWGATGLNIPQNGTDAPTSVSGKNIKYYAVTYDKSGTLSFSADTNDDFFSALPKLQTVTITDLVPDWKAEDDLSLKIVFTKAGTAKIYLENTLIFDLTDCEPFGTEFGMLVNRDQGYGKNEVIGTVKSYTYTPAN